MPRPSAAAACAGAATSALPKHACSTSLPRLRSIWSGLRSGVPAPLSRKHAAHALPHSKWRLDPPLTSPPALVLGTDHLAQCRGHRDWRQGRRRAGDAIASAPSCPRPQAPKPCHRGARPSGLAAMCSSKTLWTIQRVSAALSRASISTKRTPATSRAILLISSRLRVGLSRSCSSPQGNRGRQRANHDTPNTALARETNSSFGSQPRTRP